jgi:SAM-dependent methyltransferase
MESHITPFALAAARLRVGNPQSAYDDRRDQNPMAAGSAGSIMINSLRSFSRRLMRKAGKRPPEVARQDADYEERLRNESAQFDQCLNVHDLPDIFHYWSNRYLLPIFQPFGFTSPIDFFLQQCLECCRVNDSAEVTIVSVGAGNCDLEIDIAERLVAEGHEDFRIDCIEINVNMIERAKTRLEGSPAATRVRFLQEDFNRWQPPRASYDIVVANQSLHHVLELEHLFDAIALGLRQEGRFLVSDMIGRNGHQRWPEALAMVERFWEELPQPYRYNQLMRRQEQTYINHDCATSGFEGIRAQDILPLLIERFQFETFIPYGNIVFVFIDRPFGHNFDAQASWDRDFIDRVHAADESAMLAGVIKPTSMIAVMNLQGGETRLRDPRLTPGFCVRPTA